MIKLPKCNNSNEYNNQLFHMLHVITEINDSVKLK